MIKFRWRYIVVGFVREVIRSLYIVCVLGVVLFGLVVGNGVSKGFRFYFVAMRGSKVFYSEDYYRLIFLRMGFEFLMLVFFLRVSVMLGVLRVFFL